MKKFLLLCFSFGFAVSVWAQNRVVTGKVTSQEDSQPIPGVNIVLKGTTNGTITGADGSYSISIPSTGGILQFSFIGFQTQEVDPGARSVVDIILVQDATLLNEVVVSVAGGLQARQRDLGTANTVVNTATLTAGRAVNLAGGLQGKVAGMQINATSSGVNPDYSIVLRGARSITGNNQALIVLDGIIVPNSVLSNLNANDIESVNIQKGAGAAAIYGSLASNGVLIITTKKGKSGGVEINASHNVQMQQVAFLPKFQEKFGAGGSSYGVDPAGKPYFSQYENQSYGPAYDGSLRPLGAQQENGFQEMARYSYVKNAHSKFWEIGVTNQTDLSFSTGDDKSTLYVSGQYSTVTGTTPGDKFTRANLRINGTRKIGDKIKAAYNIVYAPNTYDITTQTGSIYDNMVNMPGNVDVARYKNWTAQGFGPTAVGNPSNYYNPWYDNPYYLAANWREKDKNNYLTANIELKFTPIKGLELTARQGISNREFFQKSFNGQYIFSDYSTHTWNSDKANVPGTVSESSQWSVQSITDFLAQYTKSFSDFHVNVVGGVQLIENQGKFLTTGIGGLVVPGLYNLSNGTGSATYSQADYKTHLMGVYGKASLSYKDFVTLTATGRNDWDSRLNKANRVFFYPSAELAVVVTDAVPSLKNNNILNFLKVRGGISKVGQVNLGNQTVNGYGVNGAYATVPIFTSQNSGFPYGSLAGYSQSNQLVTASLKPEFTSQWEVGFDSKLWQDRIDLNVTYFSSKTDNQTVNTSVSSATGFSNLLTNVGQTSAKGLELEMNVTAFKNTDWTVSVGGNYTYLTNLVNSISANIPSIILQTSSNGAIAVSAARAGQAFPIIMGTDYNRDKQGHVIVDATTGLPSINPVNQILGNATPKTRVGMNTKISYKAISFSILFEYRGGYSIYNGIGQNLDWSGTGWRTAVYDRKSFIFPNSVYSKDGGNTYIKNTDVAIVNGNGNNGFWSDGINRGTSSNYVTSGNFVKLREISLGYDLTPIISKMGSKFIKGGSISVQGRNLFLWMAKDNYYTDPEYNAAGSGNNGTGLNDAAQTPPVRYFGGTFNLKF